jgi:hypothetical protein
VQWFRFAGDDFNKIQSELNKFADRIQERHRMTRNKAARQIDVGARGCRS